MTQTDYDKSSIRILLIEDNPGDVRLIEESLSPATEAVFSLMSERDLKSGLKHLREHSVDVVLLDLALPDSSGYETFSEVLAAVPRCPIVILTGHQDEDLAARAVREGAQDYLVKGQLDENLLIRSIRYAIERKRNRDTIEQSRERYSLIANAANDGLWDWNLKTGKIYYSGRWKSMLGYEEEEIKDDPGEWLGRIHPDDMEEVQFKLDHHLKEDSSHFEHQFRMKHKEGTYIWVLARGLAAKDTGNRAYRMAGSLADVSLQKSSEKALIRSALYDKLTGLPNRALLMERLDHSMEGSKRRDLSYALLFLDLDGFKLINDNFGHIIGDKLLVEAANRLSEVLRPNDTVARLGGDEFVALLEDVESGRDATVVAERIQQTLGDPFQLNGTKMFVSTSIGIVLGSDEYTHAHDVLRDADIAMYRAKSLGKARYEMFDIGMGVSVQKRLTLENSLKTALERQEFLVHYQPIVCMEEHKPIGFEALVRWQHPEQGMISPGDFIPLAEETGLIVPIDRWLIGEVCRQITEWGELFDAGTGLVVAVNLSSRDFSSSKDIVEHVGSVLKDHNLTTSQLRLEVTESAIMENLEMTVEKLSRLRDMGVKVEVDDFGTGYCSLSYLHKFPVDGLKIDQSFVQKITDDESSLKIVRTILKLAEDLNLEVVAEGIETDSQRDLLHSIGCPYWQGYLYSKPLASADTDRILRGVQS